MTEEKPSTAPTSARGVRAGWAAAAAGIILAACLCGFAIGSILISAGVSAYSGWAGVAVTRLVVTVAFISGPTYTPLPTYTLQPTYTLLPTYTGAPTPAPVIVTLPPEAPTEAPTLPPTVAAASAPAEDVVYDVIEGDTLESVVSQFGADIVPVIVANDLDPAKPTIQAGDTITIPFKIGPLCIPQKDATDADVSGVLDGDTIAVLIGDQNNTVRYLGIDAPDLEPSPAPFASEALNENQSLVDGLTVSLVEDVSQTDSSNRLLRYVQVGDTFVNYEMVRRGMAHAVSTPPDTACAALFKLAETQASREGLGIWAQAGPGQATQPVGATTTAAVTPYPAGTTAPAITPTTAGATPYVPPAASPTVQPAAWVPPPTFTPTATSSLGFDCHCAGNFGGNYVWGNFQNEAQALQCQSICAVAGTRQAILCATQTGSLFGCSR